jgi:hypothetical protein
MAVAVALSLIEGTRSTSAVPRAAGGVAAEVNVPACIHSASNWRKKLFR